MQTIDYSYRTAITRKKLSAPMQWLKDNGLLKGADCLDYGCGKGSDADILLMDKYDPHFFPDIFNLKSYDTITCHYVLNVIEDNAKKLRTIKTMQFLLNDDGKIYISVRRDVTKNGYTKKKTYQENVFIDGLTPIHEVKGSYAIYELNKHTKLEAILCI